MYPHRKIEYILQNEELRRMKRNKLIGINDSEMTKYDLKGEVFKIRETLPEFLRAINISDKREIKRLCELINHRINHIERNVSEEP